MYLKICISESTFGLNASFVYNVDTLFNLSRFVFWQVVELSIFILKVRAMKDHSCIDYMENVPPSIDRFCNIQTNAKNVKNALIWNMQKFHSEFMHIRCMKAQGHATGNCNILIHYRCATTLQILFQILPTLTKDFVVKDVAFHEKHIAYD